MKCRHCASEVALPFLDLGSAPPSNAYLAANDLNAPEIWFPLRLRTCETCWLVQTEDFTGREAFFNADYAYFSGYSSSWLTHSERYVADMCQRFRLNSVSRVIEVAANDGYLLQYVQKAHVPCFGIEPTASTAAVAKAKGIDVVERFFGVALACELAEQGRHADLMVANNVLAHVPDINDFVAGFALLLKPHGVVTFEFPHLTSMVAQCQFDTAYHEHYSYLSLTAVLQIFNTNGLTVFDVQKLETHGGSLRVFAQRGDSGVHPKSPVVQHLLDQERIEGIDTAAFYSGFQAQAERIARELLTFLVDQKRQGTSVVAYGAAAKGNTLLNFAGIRPHLLPFVVDKNPAKQGRWLPGSRIPVVDESWIQSKRPDHVLILPWNLKQEVMSQLAYVREWGGKFVTAVPRLEVL